MTNRGKGVGQTEQKTCAISGCVPRDGNFHWKFFPLSFLFGGRCCRPVFGPEDGLLDMQKRSLVSRSVLENLDLTQA